MPLTAENREWLEETAKTWEAADGPLLAALCQRTKLTRLEALLYLLLIKETNGPDDDEPWKG